MRMLPWVTASLHANLSFHACYTCDLCLELLYTRVAHTSRGTTHDKRSQFEVNIWLVNRCLLFPVPKSNWWRWIEILSPRHAYSRLPTISFGTNFLLGTICKSQDFLVFDESQLQFVFLTISALRLTTFETEKSILLCYFPPDTVRMHRLQKQGLYWAQIGCKRYLESAVTNLTHLPFKCRWYKAYGKFSTAQLV